MTNCEILLTKLIANNLILFTMPLYYKLFNNDYNIFLTELT